MGNGSVESGAIALYGYTMMLDFSLKQFFYPKIWIIKP